MRARWGKWANGQMTQLYRAIFSNLSTGRRHPPHMKAFLLVRIHPKLLVHENQNTRRLSRTGQIARSAQIYFNLPWILRKYDIKTGLGTTDMG
jgi:hypothetical protein